MLSWFEKSGTPYSAELRNACTELNQCLLRGKNILFVGKDSKVVLDVLKCTLLISGYDLRFVCNTRARFPEFSQIIVVAPLEFHRTCPTWIHCLSQLDDRGQASLASLAASNRGGLISQMYLRDPEGSEDSFQLYAQKCTKLNMSIDLFDIVVLVQQDGDTRSLRVLKS